MSEQIYSELEQQLGLNRKEIDDTFKILDEGNEWQFVVRSGGLESKTFKIMLIWSREKGGDYTTKPLTFHVPKEKPSIAPLGVTPRVVSVDKVAGPPRIEPGPSEEEYSLTRSLKGKLGQLVPCLTDAENMVIDGFHRLKINPKAWTVKLDQVKTPVDRAMARMTVNFCRRHYTSEEMQNDIGLLIGAGYKPEQIHDVTGISLSTIYKYMPQELKDQVKAEAGRLGGISAPSSEQTVKTQDMITQKGMEDWRSQLVECSNCYQGFHKDKAIIKDGKIFCPKCAPQIKIAPRRLEDEIRKTKPEVMERWEHRAAVMKPQKSQFELDVIQELQAEGVALETDQEFCVAKTIPDAIHRGKKIAFYIDLEELHPEGNEKDERMRNGLEQFYGFTVFPIRYKANTKEEKERAKAEMREILKW